MEVKLKGLSSWEVESREEKGLVNYDTDVKTKSIKRILTENIFSLFNIINFILAAAVIMAGSYKNVLFMGIIICNTLIGIIQAIRSKLTVDKLSIMVSSQVTVMRDGTEKEIGINQIVLDDIIILKRGNQISSDSILLEGNVSVNESLLTGESDLVSKKAGDMLFSGSFISSGECVAKVVHVGKDNYATKINNSAKYIKKVKSEIMTTLNKIIKFVSFVIFPVGALLFCNQYFRGGVEFNDAIVSTVAALIGMIPEGLVLLTSTVLAVAVIRLSKYKVLVQELYCIENLARVDVLCLDKTGTITNEEMEIEKIHILGNTSKEKLDFALSSIAKYTDDDNATIMAFINYYKDKNTNSQKPQRFISFSSEKKWSGAVLSDGTAIVMGAGEFILKDRYSLISKEIEKIGGIYRVITVATTKGFDDEGNIIGEPEPVALVLIMDKIRPEAPQTIKYFTEQGVTLKVISGDNVKTVSNIAKAAGIPNAEMAVDATTLETDEDINNAVEKYSVFGRVTPHQKLKFVKALQHHKHTVAMTGDGVNDVLALKEADCSVAMASGSDAARNVAQLVLINNDFSAMPRVVAEGRRSINNIQRSASLFFVKTLFSMVLSVMFIFVNIRYPFEPIQMSLFGAFAIGIPSFVLALEPNKERVTGNFLLNILSRAIPGAVTIILNIIFLCIASEVWHITDEQISTIATIVTSFTGVILIIRICIPFNPIRTALVAFIVSGLVIGMTVFSSLFNIVPFTTTTLTITVSLIVVSFIVFNLLYNFVGSKLDQRYKKKYL